jgi:uncharacterized protein (DUF934 family)
LQRWRRDRELLLGAGARIGVRLAPDCDLAVLAGDLAHIELIALEFPKFTDGRAISLARLLRSRYGFGGEIRAVGDVLRDQLQFMERCGFDAFELRADQDARAALDSLCDFTVFYQPAWRSGATRSGPATSAAGADRRRVPA